MGREYERKDHFYKQAKEQGLRSRAAFKLLEIQKKYKLIRPADSVADLGCFPGGWTQVAAELVGPKGRVVGIDLKTVEPFSLPQIEIIEGDFTDPGLQQGLITALGGKCAVVLSDLSPSLSGIKMRDALRSAELVEEAFRFAQQCLRRQGSFLAKIFPGTECEMVVKEISRSFESFSRMNLDSTRKSSNELYLLGRKFKGN